MTIPASPPQPERPDHHRAAPSVASHHIDLGAAPPVQPMSRHRLLVIAGMIVVVLLVLLVVTILPKRAVTNELRAEASARDSAPLVSVTTVQRATTGGELALPGTIQALHEGAVFARVSGYVTRWHADIGSVVRKGDVLAEIDAPELEQNVQQAQSQLAQTRAALNLAKADLARWQSLAKDGAVTGQELDQKSATYEAAAANTGAAEANVRRLVQTRQYTRVTAPFAGVVTARNVDIGSLITVAGGTSSPIAAGGGATGAGAGSMFRLAETDTVRMYISVPENYATSIRPGLEAAVSVQAVPNRQFTGRVARTSRSLDASSRTLLTEVDIPNRDFALLPGMYAQVKLQFARVTPPLLLPSTALVIRSNGPQVMIVQRGNDASSATVHFRSVQIARDYGATVELASGLEDGQSVVMNPSSDLIEGTRVRIVAAPGAEPARGVPATPR